MELSIFLPCGAKFMDDAMEGCTFAHYSLRSVNVIIYHTTNTKEQGKFLYRSGTVNSKSFVGKVLLRIKRKFELN